MKKVLFSLLLMLAVSATVTAQSKIRFGLRLSPIFGITQTIVDSTKAVYKPTGAGSRLGLAYGLTVIYQVADNFGIQSGLSYVNRGYTIKNSTLKQNTRLSCLEVPLYLRLRSRLVGPESLGIRIRGLVGASADVNLATMTKATYAGFAQRTSTDMANYQPIAASGVFGLGVEWDLNKVGVLDLGVSYHRGLTNVYKKALPLTQKMGYVGIDIGYLF